MSNRRNVRSLVIAVVVACVLLSSGSQRAGAQQADPGPSGATGTTLPTTPPTGANPAPNTWSVAPTGTDPAKPANRPNFTYELGPGTSMRDAATIWNYSDEQRTFRIYAKDAFTTSAGAIDLLAADRQSLDVGSWINFDTSSVTVPARAGVSVPFTIAVPADATPGDHSGGIVASLATGAPSTTVDGQRVVVDHRVGLRVYLRVSGELDPALEIRDVTIRYDGGWGPLTRGTVEVGYTVANVGNVRLQAGQRVSVRGPFGLVLGERGLEDLPELLPGDELVRTATVEGIYPAVRVEAVIELTPFPVGASADERELASIVERAQVWAWPWGLTGILLGLLLAISALAGRRRSIRRPATGPGGARVPAAGAVETPDRSPSQERI